MSWLTADELAAMRAAVAELLPDTVVIVEMVRTSDGAGGWAEVETPVAGGTVAARFDPVVGRNNLDVLAGRETLTVYYRCTLPHDAPLAAGRRIVAGARRYDIMQMDKEHSWNVSRRTIVSEAR